MSSILTSLKVTGSVSVAAGGNYTAPSTGYAIVTVSPNTTGSVTFTIGGKSIIMREFFTGGGCPPMVVYIGPSLQIVMPSSAVCVGVEFSNS